MKKFFILLFIGLCFVSTVYAGEPPTVLYDQAKILYQQSLDTDSTKVKKAYRQQILKLVPESDLGYFSKAWLLDIEDTPDFNKATIYYSKAIELNPDLVIAYSNRGCDYIALGQYQKAIDDYTKAIELDPKFAYAYNNRGRAFHVLGEYQNAIDDYTKAMELDSEINVYYFRGQAYYELGEKYEINQSIYEQSDEEKGQAKEEKKELYLQSIEDLSKAIETDTTNSEIYLNRGVSYERIEENEKAINDHTIAIKLNPKFALAYRNRGHYYKIKNLLTTADDDFYQAGLLYLKQGYGDDAIECLNSMDPCYDFKTGEITNRVYTKLLNKICEYYYNNCLQYLNKNDRTEALKCIDKIKEVNPKSSLIKQLMDKIYAEPTKKKK